MCSAGVGIGTTAPQYMLDVSGTAQVNGVVTLTQGQPDSTILPNPFDVIGQTWTAVSGLSTSAAWYRSAISATGQYMTACINGAASGNNIYYSSNYGSTWTLATGFATNAAYYGLGMSPTGQYQLATIDTSGSVLYASSNYGATWSTVGYTLTNATGRHVCFSSTGQYQFVATNGAGGKIVISSNYGTSFANTAAITANWSSVCCSSNGAYVSACPFGSTIYYSTNTGTSWTASASLSANWTSICCSSTGQYQIAVVYSGNIYYSSNYGVNWTLSNSVSAVWVSVSCTSSGQYATAVTFGGYIYYSTNFGQTWVQSGSASANWQCVTMSQNGLYSLACVATSGAVYLSVATPATATVISNGRVGIGLTNPPWPLSVTGTNYSSSAGTNVSATLTIAGNYGNAGISQGIAGGYIEGGTNYLVNTYMAFGTNGGSGGPGISKLETMRITNGGQVGIGTANPGSLLTVCGIGSTASANTTLLLDTSASMTTAEGQIGILNFANNGTIGAAIQCGLDVGGANNNGTLRFYTRQDYVTYGERMRITRTGNVGIGITNPNATLHVNGTISVNGGTLCARASNYIASGGSYTRTVTLGGGETGGALEVTITGYGVSGGGWAVYKIIIYGNMPSSSGFNLSSTTVLSNTYGYAPIFTVSSVNNPSSGSYTIVLTISSPGSIFINAMVVSIGSTLATISIS
jgi:hypothetical protein